MHFLREATTFLKTRIVPIPRALFGAASRLGLSFSELDFLCRLFDFNMDGTVRPEIEGLAENAGANEKTYRRAAESLRAKGLISKKQIRGADGRLSANSYDLSGLYESLASHCESGDAGQLRLFSRSEEDLPEAGQSNSVRARFGVHGDAILSHGFFFVPRAMDSHLAGLGVDRYAAMVAKYLFSKADGDGKALVRVREITSNLPIGRTKALEALAALSAAGLLGISERSVLWRKSCSQYDLVPMVRKLEELEKKKVRKKLEAKGEWKNRRASGKKRAPAKKIAETLAAQAAAVRGGKGVRKDSREAAEIRALEAEAAAAANGTRSFSSMAEMIAARYWSKHSSSSLRKADPHREHAERVCRKLRGDWERNSRLYFKAVTRFPNTVDRMVAAALELSRKSPERYFAKCVSEKCRGAEKIPLKKTGHGR